MTIWPIFLFFEKTIVFIGKQKTFYGFLCCIDKCRNKFAVFMIINAFGNMSESTQFRFQNSLKMTQQVLDFFFF